MWSRSGKNHAKTMVSATLSPGASTTETAAAPCAAAVPTKDCAPEKPPVAEKSAKSAAGSSPTPKLAEAPAGSTGARVTSPFAGPPAPPAGLVVSVSERPLLDHVPCTPQKRPAEKTLCGTSALSSQRPVAAVHVQLAHAGEAEAAASQAARQAP